MWTFENIRHILNAQLEFQHCSDISEIQSCTSEIVRHAFKCISKVSQNCLNWSIAALWISDIFSTYHKTIWIDQLLHFKFQTYFQPTYVISNNIPMYLKISDIKHDTVNEKVLKFRYFSHNTVSVQQCCFSIRFVLLV